MSRYSDLILAEAGLLGYWPLDAEFGVTDKSSGGHNLTAAGAPPPTVGGAVLLGELTGTDLDGVDDRFTSAWLTRRNRCTNPKAGTLATTNWVNNSLPTFDTTGALPTTGGLPSGVTTGFHCIADATADGMDFTMSGGLNGEIYTISVYARIVTLGGANRIELVDRTGTAPVTVSPVDANSRLSVVGGNFTRMNAGFTLTGDGTIKFGIRSNGAGTPEWHVTAVQIEKTTVTNVPTTYFDGATGSDAGWEGAADLSASGKGPFTINLARSFEWWFNRDDTAAVHTLLSGDGAANNPYVRLASGSNDLIFSADSAGASSTFSGAWPTPGSPGHGMLVYDGANVKLLVNGALVASNAYSTAYNLNAARNPLLGARIATTDPANGKLAHPVIYAGDKSAVAGIHYNAGLYRFARGTGPAPWYSAA